MEVNPKTGKKEPIYEIDETTGKKRKIQLPLKNANRKKLCSF